MSDKKYFNQNISVSVSTSSIDLKNMFSFLQNPSHGAISTFVGRVRNINMNKNVIGVSYDVFEPLAIETFKEICKKVTLQAVNLQHELTESDLNIYIEHFKGRLDVGGISIAIGVSSMHRSEAIKACSYIIESVKHNAPIWKQEHYESSSSEWIKGHSLCK